MDCVISPGDGRKMSQATIFALAATQEALRQSGLLDTNEVGADQSMMQQVNGRVIDPHRCGVAVGMGMVDLDYISSAGQSLAVGRRLSPHFIPRILLNMAAGYISMKFGLWGPNHTVSTACTTGAHAIGDAYRMIQGSLADVMVCGSAEASVSPLSIAGFSSMRALSSHYNHRPKEASRPFDIDRDGFVMGEGAGVIILEELSHARRRKARIYGEVMGYGMSGDAHHVSSPRPDGQGAIRCMEMACQPNSSMAYHPSSPVDHCPSSSLLPCVSYINAHATSTPQGDEIEYSAISKLFTSPQTVHISSTKGGTGHLLGGAGSVEAVFTILACDKGRMPPCVNLNNPQTMHDHLPYVTGNNTPWTQDRRIALTNSFGFGGTNASLCIGNYIEE